MIKARVLTLLLFIFLAFAGNLKAQTADAFGIWTSVSYGLEITDKLDLDIDEEVRMNVSGPKIDTYFTNIGLTYKINKHIRLGAGYRWINKQGSDRYWGSRHRLLGDITLRAGEHRFQYQLRNRVQREDRGYGSFDEYGVATKWQWRQTIKITYQLNQRHEPYFYLDFREVLADPREPDYTGFDRHRLRFGWDYKVNRTQTLGIFLMQSQHWNIEERERLFVIGLEYSFGNASPLF